jgi:hypothetical protein
MKLNLRVGKYAYSINQIGHVMKELAKNCALALLSASNLVSTTIFSII